MKLRFARICSEELVQYSKVDDGIGTYAEKRLHVTLKRFVCDDPECYEIKVNGEPSESQGRRGRRGFVADVLTGNTVYEIQTASLYPLKSKIEFLLERTELELVVVHPLIEIKWVAWIDPGSGVVSKRHRSPKKENVFSIARDLYAMIPFIRNERFRIMLPVIEAEEYRMLDGWGRGGKLGSSRVERYPLSLIDVIELNTSEDYLKYYLPPDLPESFTASEYSRLIGSKGIAPYSLLSVLCELGTVEKGEKVGRSFIYRKK
ncbi:MAG: hypothetical protein IKA82_02355 [Clostridia bacterium]|nr:hypothetical protein [Clostridia bacterium]